MSRCLRVFCSAFSAYARGSRHIHRHLREIHIRLFQVVEIVGENVQGHVRNHFSDFAIIQASIFVTASLIFVMNILIDLLYARLDPRVRHA